MRKYLPLLMVTSLYSSYDYHLQMSFRRGPTPHDSRIEYKVNESDVLCECGRKPVCSMFFYGNPEHYCEEHIPEIERVTRITPANLDQFLANLNNVVEQRMAEGEQPKVGPRNWNHSDDLSNMNINGAHVGVEAKK
jgi:hypothetical protein